MGNSPGYTLSSNKITNWDEQEVATGKQNATAACPKNKLEFNFQAQHIMTKKFLCTGLKICKYFTFLLYCLGHIRHICAVS